MSFPSVRIEGGLLGPDILDLLVSGDLAGQKPVDFGLEARRNLTDEIAATFADARALWRIFQHRLERLAPDDPATSVTRDAWMIPFLGLLGYELQYNPRAYDVEGLTFAISHRAVSSAAGAQTGAAEVVDGPPVHIVGARQELGKLASSGRPRLAPHSLVQEYLNRTEFVWGIVTNGLTLRLLRDSTFVRRQAYVEIDLTGMFEEQRFGDFAAFYRLLHRTRLPHGPADAATCFLEQYHTRSLVEGSRIREHLRDGVQRCIEILAEGFLSHPANEDLRREIEEGRLTPEDLYRQLLRLIYRFLFLLVAEDRGLISQNALYCEYYGIGRLRNLFDRRGAFSDHEDLWYSLRVLWHVLSDERLSSILDVAPLNGELFRSQTLDDCILTNRNLLEAFRHLAWYRENRTAQPRRVNYSALDVEELGSVYESLLELHPHLDASIVPPRFELIVSGRERRSTGSHYTPPELVAPLIENALGPVIQEKLGEAKRIANGEWRTEQERNHALAVVWRERVEDGEWRVVNGEWRSKDGRVVSRSRCVEAGHDIGERGVQVDDLVAEGRALWADLADSACGKLHSGEHRRRLGQEIPCGIHPVPEEGKRQPHRAGDTSPVGRGDSALPDGTDRPAPERTGDPRQADPEPGEESRSPHQNLTSIDQFTPPATHHSPFATHPSLLTHWKSTPFATRYSLLAQKALLTLRVCDPACGSGHFLLAAARRIGKELARVRTGEQEPAPEGVREAVREVIHNCIYGVDKNPLAVDLCRVALWIEGHTTGKPLTFLDQRICCGDSLVGVLELKDLDGGIPDAAFKPVTGDDRTAAREAKRRNAAARGATLFQFPSSRRLQVLAQQLRSLGHLPEDTMEQVRDKAESFSRLVQSDDYQRLKLACDVWSAAFFQPFPGPSAMPVTTADVQMALMKGRLSDPRMTAFVQETAAKQRFFHWPLAFPEVFGGGGFDAIIGNPPFLGGLRVSGEYGLKYRQWLSIAFEPFTGTADLCAAFFRRSFHTIRPEARFGLIATNTIGQGDTRESGLAPIVSKAGSIVFARRFVKWPGAANVEVNLVAVRKGPSESEFRLDDQLVPSISSRLDDEPEAEPHALRQNQGKAFQGDIVRGIGFVLEPGEASQILHRDPQNGDCLLPYLNGEDLNTHPQQEPSRYVICFHDWPLERAEQYPDLLRIVEERVRPERERLRNRDDRHDREYWWLFARYRSDMRPAIGPLSRVMARSRVSELHAVSLVPKGWICNEQTVVFAFEDFFHFALIQSNIHEAWLRRNASTMRTDIRYTPTDCFETFAFPQNPSEASRSFAEQLGASYHAHRRQIMLDRQIGLTKTYNLFHNPQATDADILRLRELHAEMDMAVLACYGWDNLDLEHGFHENERGQTRYTISSSARRDLLRRLLALNLDLFDQETRERNPE